MFHNRQCPFRRLNPESTFSHYIDNENKINKNPTFNIEHSSQSILNSLPHPKPKLKTSRHNSNRFLETSLTNPQNGWHNNNGIKQYVIHLCKHNKLLTNRWINFTIVLEIQTTV